MGYMGHVQLRMEAGYRKNGVRLLEAECYKDDSGWSIVLNNTKYRTFDDLRLYVPHLASVLSADPEIRDGLKEAGFPAKDIEARKLPLHVTVDERMIERISKEAEDRSVKMSAVIMDILNDHYGTDY